MKLKNILMWNGMKIMKFLDGKREKLLSLQFWGKIMWKFNGKKCLNGVKN